MTQQELAARLEKPRSFVSAYEAGQRRVDLLEFIRIMGALQADPVKAFTTLVENYLVSLLHNSEKFSDDTWISYHQDR